MSIPRTFLKPFSMATKSGLPFPQPASIKQDLGFNLDVNLITSISLLYPNGWYLLPISTEKPSSVISQFSPVFIPLFKSWNKS